MRRLVFCGLTFAMFAGAADLAGTWRNEMQDRRGQTLVTTCVFKVDGNKISGTYATPQRAFTMSSMSRRSMASPVSLCALSSDSENSRLCTRLAITSFIIHDPDGLECRFVSA